MACSKNKIECMHVVVVGDKTVGKSALIKVSCEDVFDLDYNPTVGVDYNSKLIEVDSNVVQLCVWDSAGSEHFLWALQTHVANADAFIYVYDMTNLETFNNVEKWFQIIQKYATKKDLPRVLVGNKSDMRRNQSVSSHMAKEYCIPENMVHLEVSAMTRTYVDLIFHTVANEVLRYRNIGYPRLIGVPPLLPRDVTEHCGNDASGCNSCSAKLPCKHLFKILLLGSSSSGKTSIRYNFCKNYYRTECISTPTFDYSTKCVYIDDEHFEVQVWDISSSPMYDNWKRDYYRKADAFVLVYDVTSRDSLIYLDKILKELDVSGCQNTPKIVAGNKNDMKNCRNIPSSIGSEFAKKWNIPFFEISAQNGTNVNGVFLSLLDNLKHKQNKNSPWKRIYNFDTN